MLACMTHAAHVTADVATMLQRCIEWAHVLLIQANMQCAAVAALGASAPGDVTSPDYAAEPFDCKYAPATALDAANTAGTDSSSDT